MQLSEAGTLAKHKILHIEAMFFRTGAELFLADVLALRRDLPVVHRIKRKPPAVSSLDKQ